jgi:hypothetical protein
VAKNKKATEKLTQEFEKKMPILYNYPMIKGQP